MEQQSKRDGNVFMASEELPSSGLTDAALTDAEIADKHKNPIVPTVATPCGSKKMQITRCIYDNGIRYSLRSDNDFTFPVGRVD